LKNELAERPFAEFRRQSPAALDPNKLVIAQLADPSKRFAGIATFVLVNYQQGLFQSEYKSRPDRGSPNREIFCIRLPERVNGMSSCFDTLCSKFATPEGESLWG
jgi:hypothetical protein